MPTFSSVLATAPMSSDPAPDDSTDGDDDSWLAGLSPALAAGLRAAADRPSTEDECDHLPTLMLKAGLLLQRHAERHPDRPRVEIPAPSWCVDGFEMARRALETDECRAIKWSDANERSTLELQMQLRCLTPKQACERLRAGADLYGKAEGVDFQPTPLQYAQAAAAAGRAAEGTAAFLVLEAAKPWSRNTHHLFPAPARARAVEMMLIGELLSREERFAAYGPQAVVDAWMTFVVPQAVSRNRVQVVGLTGRTDLNGQNATIGDPIGATLYQGWPRNLQPSAPISARLDSGEAVMIKMMNLVSIGDDTCSPSGRRPRRVIGSEASEHSVRSST